LNIAILKVRIGVIEGVVFIILMGNYVEHLSGMFLAVEKVLLRSFAHFKIELFFFYYEIIKDPSIFYMQILYQMSDLK
jgi:hypothetical protein